MSWIDSTVVVVKTTKQILVEGFVNRTFVVPAITGIVLYLDNPILKWF